MNVNIGLSAVATGTADVITATYAPAITLSDRRIVFLRVSTPNATTTPTFNPNALGAQVVKGKGGTTLKIGELTGDCILMYHTTGTYWEVLNSTPFLDATSSIQTQLGNKQPLDSDLTAIAGLTPSDDDIIQRKSGAWVNRTLAQLWADLKDLTVTLTNKTLAVASNSITGTASRAAQFGSGGSLEASSVTSTELGYLSGVTSSIQTQLNANASGDIDLTNPITVESDVFPGSITGTFSSASF